MTENVLINGLLRPFFRKARAQSFQIPGALSDQVRILAIDPGDLTDLLFHVPLLSGIRQEYPGAHIDFLLPEEHTPLVVPSGLARQCLVYNPKQVNSWSPAIASLLRSVRKNTYDVSFLMSMTPHSVLELASLASGAALRCGPSHKQSYPSINFEIRPTASKSQYRGQRAIAAATFLGLPESSLDYRWPLPDDKQRQMRQLVHFNKPRKDELLVGVDPGFGKEGRSIGLPNLHFLVKQLTSQLPCRVLPLTDPHNQERLKQFEQRLTGPPPNLARDTLLETVLLLDQCDLFVACNTDLFHFAVAQSVPTIGLFSQTDGPDWDPGNRKNTRILRITRDERVDIDTLMEAVESVLDSHMMRQPSP